MSRTDPGPGRAAPRIRAAVATLNPGYFALIMATGIVSVAMRNHHAEALSVTLLWIAGLSYATVIVLHVWRLVSARAAMAADFTDPTRAFGFFTFVAATDVLGTRLAADAYNRAALAALVVGWLGWIVLGYVVPWTAVLRQGDRPVLRHANGTWFIWVVASQSIGVLAATLEPVTSTADHELELLAVFSWSIGVFLYAAAGIFVAARMLLYDLRPIDLTPPYWVAMGATAITVVAGSSIVRMTGNPVASAARELIAGGSIVFWAFGTWLIPPLIAAGVWRHMVHRIPLRYEATWWSVVFPLGMYGVGGQVLGAAEHLPIVSDIGSVETWIALAAWALVFLAMLGHLVRTLVTPDDRAS